MKHLFLYCQLQNRIMFKQMYSKYRHLMRAAHITTTNEPPNYRQLGKYAHYMIQ